MNYIQKLLNGEKVEWKTLGEVCKINKGKQLNKTELRDEGEYPAYNGGKSYSGFTNNYNVEANTIIVSQGGASAGFVNFITTKFWANAHCYYLLPNLEVVDNRYLYHFMKSNERYFMEVQHGAGIPALATNKLANHKIPIPPLPVQQKIAEILDRFAELEAELHLREKQYNYYRNHLLTPNEQGLLNGKKVEWKSLGEIGEVRMCKRILKNQTLPIGDIPFYKIGTFGKNPNAFISRELFEEYKKKYNYPRKGEILISASGTIGRTVIFDGKDSYFQDSNIVWIENDEKEVLNKFLFYYYKIANWNIAEGGIIQRLYNDNLKKIPIPIPPMEEQERIVKILDKFDTLVNSISEGLPKEIALRRKQYEYYREQLLSF